MLKTNHNLSEYNCFSSIEENFVACNAVTPAEKLDVLLLRIEAEENINRLKSLLIQDIKNAGVFRIRNYSNYVAGKSCNGGAYGFTTKYTMQDGGDWRVEYLTTSDFEYCRNCGVFHNSSDWQHKECQPDLISIEEVAIAILMMEDHEETNFFSWWTMSTSKRRNLAIKKYIAKKTGEDDSFVATKGIMSLLSRQNTLCWELGFSQYRKHSYVDGDTIYISPSDILELLNTEEATYFDRSEVYFDGEEIAICDIRKAADIEAAAKQKQVGYIIPLRDLPSFLKENKVENIYYHEGFVIIERAYNKNTLVI